MDMNQAVYGKASAEQCAAQNANRSYLSKRDAQSEATVGAVAAPITISSQIAYAHGLMDELAKSFEVLDQKLSPLSESYPSGSAVDGADGSGEPPMLQAMVHLVNRIRSSVYRVDELTRRVRI